MSELHEVEASEKGSCLVKITQVVSKVTRTVPGSLIFICLPTALPHLTANAIDGLSPEAAMPLLCWSL